ncbi:MAG: protein-ADP-ribose hydrolase [Christensenellaceae bacterium]
MLEWKEYRDRIRMTPYEHDERELSEDERAEICKRVLSVLLKERGEIAAFNSPYGRRRRLIRGYFNMREPSWIDPALLADWDRVLWAETKEKGIVDVNTFDYRSNVALWQGDITRLNADAIVNAGNHSLLGCFRPAHNCIDNVIHSAAGPQLRGDCAKIIAQQGCYELPGYAKATCAYNLPSKYVFHTVGPMVETHVTDELRSQLRQSYTSCLELAYEMGLKSVAFCCISTGVFAFPSDEAAEIATGAVFQWLARRGNPLKVIFDVFLDRDREIYENILGMM